MTTSPPDGLRERLRAIRVLDPATLPPVDPDAAPATPRELFVDWLDHAVAAGLPAPHAMNLATAAVSGEVAARTVILKDLDDHGWHFATDATSPKARDLAENPRAALTFFWPAHGRQVRLAGAVTDLGPEAGAADFLARPEGSRAAALLGRQGEPLSGREEHLDAYQRALERVRADPRLVAPHWRVYALAPHTAEFWQATPDAAQIRLRYRATDAGWTRGLVWP